MLPLTKLVTLPAAIRAALKARHITTCGQLLAAASKHDARVALADAARIDPDQLTDLVCRADLSRVRGVGFVARTMLQELDVVDVSRLAGQDPTALQERLRRYNEITRTLRRSPNLHEVADWVAQARQLPQLVTYAHPRADAEAARARSRAAR